MTPFAIHDEPDSSAAGPQAVLEILRAYNRLYLRPTEWKPLNLIARREDGTVVGGLLGELGDGWLRVDVLAVLRDQRGQGIGSALMDAAEARARVAGCIGVHLETLEFQARGFYEKRGYTLFGTLADFPVGCTKYYLQKRLDTLSA